MRDNYRKKLFLPIHIIEKDIRIGEVGPIVRNGRGLAVDGGGVGIWRHQYMGYTINTSNEDDTCSCRVPPFTVQRSDYLLLIADRFFQCPFLLFIESFRRAERGSFAYLCKDILIIDKNL